MREVFRNVKDFSFGTKSHSKVYTFLCVDCSEDISVLSHWNFLEDEYRRLSSPVQFDGFQRYIIKCRLKFKLFKFLKDQEYTKEELSDYCERVRKTSGESYDYEPEYQKYFDSIMIMD